MICTKCGRDKSTQEFSRHRGRKTGLNAWCRECVKVYHAARYRQNKPAVAMKTRIHYRRNADAIRLRSREWYKSKKSIIVVSRRNRYASDEKFRQARLDAAKQQRTRSPEAMRLYKENERRRLRAEVLAAYGGKCACPGGCGESRPEFLAIDHIDGGGERHRKQIGASNLYRWLRRNGYPTDRFRLLCHNCNASLGFYGYCPHETAGEQTA